MDQVGPSLFGRVSMCQSEGWRRGALLPTLLLLIVAVTLLAQGAIVLARAQLDVSIGARAALTARLSAEAGVFQAMTEASAWPSAESLWRPQPVLQGPFGPSGRFRITGTAIDQELALWVGIGEDRGHPGTYQVGRLAWRLAPASRLAATEALVMSGGGLSAAPGSAVDGTDLRRHPPDWTEADCESFTDALEWAVPTGRLPPSAVISVDSGAVPSLGLLDGSTLMERSRSVGPGMITPLPTQIGGACRTETATNWGSPSHTGACDDHYVLASSSGSLTLLGGEGQGVLVVDGSLSLESASRFAGVILVSGDVSLKEGVRIDGLVRAGGSVSVSDSSRIVGSGCATLAALSSIESLRRPLPVSHGGWVSPLGPVR